MPRNANIYRQFVVKTTAAAVILSGCLLMSPARVGAVSSHSHVDTQTTDARFGVDEAYLQADNADELGARWSRIPFIWSYIQPTQGSWNDFALSSHGTNYVVDGELARGRSVVGLLLGTPKWATPNGQGGEASAPVNIDKAWNDPANYWGAYCYHMANEFKGRIDDWIIWNEVSIPAGANGTVGLWQQWTGTQAQYARLLEVAYEAIHAANPNAQVIMYGDPYWYDGGKYLQTLYTRLANAPGSQQNNGYFDVANLHLYSNPTDFYWIVEKVRGLLGAHGWSNKPIWVSETNAEPYDGVTPNEPHTNFRVSMDAQASFLVDAFASYIAAGVSHIEIYRMFDGVETKKFHLPPWGLVDNSGNIRPVGTTFRFLVRLFRDASGGSYTGGELLDGKAGVFKVVVDKPGERITVLWNQTGHSAAYQPPAHSIGGITYDADGNATYLLPAHATQATLYDKFGNATTITPSNGDYALHLKAGTDFTDPYDDRVPTVGGDPAIVVESVGA